MRDKETDGYWVSCIYGHEQIWLAQAIPAASTRCKSGDFEGSAEDQSVS
ncbi:STY0301 family protein, partial [Salmonella enterica]